MRMENVQSLFCMFQTYSGVLTIGYLIAKVRDRIQTTQKFTQKNIFQKYYQENKMSIV